MTSDQGHVTGGPIRGQPPAFLSGGGEMGAFIRGFDWTQTPLGAPDGWPQSLRTAARLLLNARHPMYIWWGPDLICLYNQPIRDDDGRIVGIFVGGCGATEQVRGRAQIEAINATLHERIAQAVSEPTAIEVALRQSQKMEAIGQLTGGIAHDFNNLLAGISGSLEMLGARLTQGRVSETDRYVTAAKGAAKRAAALTHRLLAFARRQTLDPKPSGRC